MKALFAGLGSAGQRHLTNLKRLLNDDVELLAFRQTGHRLRIADCRAEAVESLDAHYGMRSFSSLDAALDERPDVVFVTNPASMHLEVATAAVQRGCHVFIEKPLSHTLDGVDDLLRVVNERQVTAAVGYQTRFHPCVRAASEIVAGGEFGHVVSASFEWGTWLPSHHPYEDYRQSCNAVAALGGGVVLSLSHEIDLIHALLGTPTVASAAGGSLSDLGIDADDTALALMACGQDDRCVPVSLDLSFAQPKETRSFRIRLARATLTVDLIANSFEATDQGGKITRGGRFPDFRRNDLFVSELRDFLGAVRERRQPAVSLTAGAAALQTALRIKQHIGGAS